MKRRRGNGRGGQEERKRLLLLVLAFVRRLELDKRAASPCHAGQRRAVVRRRTGRCAQTNHRKAGLRLASAFKGPSAPLEATTDTVPSPPHPCSY